MIRALFFLVFITLVAAAAIWFADRPGAVSVDWLGWRIETSVGVLAAAVVVLGLVIAVLARIWGWLLRGPRAWRRFRAERRRRKGYDALTRGMVAVAAGDPAEAARQARRAEDLLEQPPLTLLLSAQAAQLSGDDAAARRYFEMMRSRPETEFMALRGLLNLANREDDRAGALTLARRAHEIEPGAAWVIETLFDLETRAGDWNRADRLLRDAARHNVFRGAGLARRRAIVAYELGRRKAGAEGERLLRRAHDYDAAFVPASMVLAARMIADGRVRPAARILEQAWRILPQAPIAALYLQTIDDTDPLKRLKRVEHFVANNGEQPESHLLVAQAALEASLWGHARRHLDLIPDEAVTRTVCRAHAELEEAEHGDAGKVRFWLDRAADARLDPTWVCDKCGAAHAIWEAICSRCGAFDGAVWRSPTHTTGILSGSSAAAGGAEKAGRAIAKDLSVSGPAAP